MLFDIEKSLVKKDVSVQKVAVTIFAVVGIACTLSPVLLKEYIPDKTLRGCLLFFGIVNSAAFYGSLKYIDKSEKIEATLEEADTAILRSAIQYQISYRQSVDKIDAMRHMAYTIGELPVWERKRWIGQFDLFGILPPIVEPSSPKLEGSSTIDVQARDADETEKPDIEDLIDDYEYLEIEDKEFIYESKAVFGSKGSGKSSYLAWEAIKFCEYFPDGYLIIGDEHYDSEDSKWLPFVPEQILVKKNLVNSSEGIFKVLNSLEKILDFRKKNGIKIGKPGFYPIKFIWDEVLATLDELDKLGGNRVENSIRILEKIQFQGRKYGIEFTGGFHSIKKLKAGLDSSFYTNVTILALGKAITDSTIKFPADFNITQLCNEIDALSATVPKNKGIPCVVRRVACKPLTKILPNISTLPTRAAYAQNRATTENKQSGYADAIAEWIDQLDEIPTDEEIRVKWLELTNNEIEDRWLKILKDKLGL